MQARKTDVMAMCQRKLHRVSRPRKAGKKVQELQELRVVKWPWSTSEILLELMLYGRVTYENPPVKEPH